MSEQVRDKYFLLIKLVLLIVFSIYGIMNTADKTGVSVKILLLVSFYIGSIAAKEFMNGYRKVICAAISFIIFLILIYIGGAYFILLGFLSIYEILSLFPGIDHKLYFVPLIGVIVDSPIGFLNLFVIVFMMTILYVQQNYVVTGYLETMRKDLEKEQNLKKDMIYREYSAKAEFKQSLLNAQNQILEERATLSQTLHDKLGHSINGSIYQLEGVKVLMEKDPEKSRSMIQAVIDQLRTGMDEIRAILRKERPEKKELAMIQLYKLCEDCNDKGVKTDLNVEGDISVITDTVWEIILDNAFEAVSNSMKYAKCHHIDIVIKVMNKMVKCLVSDDGIGCSNIKDGMGISGMRKRMRAVNGTLDFESEVGFCVTMLIPL